MPLPVFVTNEQKQFVFANKAVERFYGYSITEFLKLSLDDLAVGSEDKNKYEKIFLTSLMVGQGSRFKRKHKTKFGKILEVDVEWTVHESEGKKFTISIIKDVTIYSSIKQNYTLRSPKAGGARLLNSILNSIDCLFLVLSEDFIITNCSKGYLNTHDDKLFGQNFFKYYEKDIQADPRLLQIKILDEDNPLMIIENYSHSCHSRETIIDIQAHIINVNSQQKYLVYLKDRTEIISYQKNIQRLGELNEGKNRLVLLGETIAGIAHEINNPLASLLINAEMLKKKNDSREIEQIIKDVSRIAKITKNLLSFSRQDSHLKIKINVKDEIEDVLPILKSNLQDISLKIEMDEVCVFGDPIEFSQIILNLLKNSIDALEAKENKEIQLQVKSYFDKVEISISDNGCGIPAENLNKIFEPFFTTKEIGKGTGLGLSNVFFIVEKMNGQIKVSSEENVKTTFTITLPNITSLEEIFDSETGSFYKKKVLIIDDDYLLLEVLEKIFKDEGAVVFTENCSIEGMKLIFENDFDLVLLDEEMPVISGPELYKALLENGYDVSRIILMSHHTNGVGQVEDESDHRLKFIQKPFTLNMLKTII